MGAVQRYPPGLDEPGGLATVLRTGEANLVAEIDDEMLRALARDDHHFAALRELDIAAGLTAPLVVRGRVIGALTLLFGAARRRPGDAALDLATQVAARAATAIDNARLYRDRSHIARTLQRSLLPPRLPRIEGFEIAARYRAAGDGDERRRRLLRRLPSAERRAGSSSSATSAARAPRRRPSPRSRATRCARRRSSTARRSG